MNQSTTRQTVKISYWRFLRPAPSKVYPSGYHESRGIYLCTLCEREFNLCVKSEANNKTTCCVSCSRSRTFRKSWKLLNLDTKEQTTVVNLSKWCKAHNVCYTVLLKTRPDRIYKQPKGYASDGNGQRWKIIQKLN